jgi:hypothetical protein
LSNGFIDVHYVIQINKIKVAGYNDSCLAIPAIWEVEIERIWWRMRTGQAKS